MSLLWPIIGICAVIICIVEAVLWRLFIRNMAPLLFPREVDTSYFRFCTLPRMRAVAIVHTLFLLCVCIAYLFLVW